MKYLLLGFVLMLSGLQVTVAQEVVQHICGNQYHFQSEKPENYALVIDNETIYPSSGELSFDSSLGYVTVWIGLQYYYVEADAADCTNTKTQETAMITFIHEARQRGVWAEFGGHDGE